jgi:hypothetical protein
MLPVNIACSLQGEYGMATDDTAANIVLSAVHDTSGDPKRHEHRMRAMRMIGEAERRTDRLLKMSLVLVIAIPILFIAGALLW